MKKFLYAVVILLFTYQVMGQETVTGEILSRVLNISYNNQQGSGFFIEHDSINYIVTAKHIFGDTLPNKSKITIKTFKDGGWEDIDGEFLKHSNPKLDIALFKHKKPTETNHFVIETDGYVISENTFFLGFPYGLKMEDFGNINKGYPIPFVKKATLSAGITMNGIHVLFLDGHNNPGFSGGPVIAINGNKNPKYKWKIIGVVSSYVNQNNELVTPSGNLSYKENSGIIMAMSSQYIYEIIDGK